MAWQSYSLDQIAQCLVLTARQRDRKSLNQSFKMRGAIAYGLERFWGEHLRLQDREPNKSLYWKATWDALVNTMNRAGVIIPNDEVNANNPTAVRAMAQQLWGLTIEEQRLSLAILTQLCDSIVWWTQRYKGSGDLPNDDDES